MIRSRSIDPETRSAMDTVNLQSPPPRDSVAPARPRNAATTPRGAVILGGSHGTIALARLLARHHLDVHFFTDDTPLPRFSRAVHKSARWPGAADPDTAVDFLKQAAARDGLGGTLLIPSTDADVRFVALEHRRLSRTFDVMLPDWDSLKWAADKSLTYECAGALGLKVPLTYAVGSRAEAEAATLDYPVALKPAMRLAPNRFTRDKVWRAADRAEFVMLYNQAADLVGEHNIVVQELIPGGGDCQLSYGALWWHGKPVAAFTARRTRQYPVEFSYTSTFVETIKDDEVRAASEKFLKSCGHHGLVEIEYKRDPRNGELKMLDVNPRPWTWFGLADAAGIDFGALIAAASRGERIEPITAKSGVGWLFAQRDIVVAGQLALAGRLDWGRYLSSLTRTRTLATFSPADPLPALVEVPLTLARVLKRRLAKR